MTATTMTTLRAITHTTNAKTTLKPHGQDLDSLRLLIEQHILDLQALINQMANFYPQGGGDASNYTALTGIASGLA